MASLEEIRSERLRKLEQLGEAKMAAYPVATNSTHTLKEVGEAFVKLAEDQTIVTLAGRVMARRGQGGLIFIDLFDGTAKFQGVAKKDSIGEELMVLFDTTVDVGDFIEVTGTLFTTKQGENTIEAKSWRMLSKSLRPLPDKWHGLQDTEERYRRRYLDSLTDDEVRNRFIARSKIIQAIRQSLIKDDFLEVETSMLEYQAGGATAKPFLTHHEALDTDLYLRIAPELNLKKMLIGGFPKVFEIGRCFRNEGIDATHNPEFTMLEFYAAFSNATLERERVEQLIKTVAKESLGQTTFNHEGVEIDLAKPFAVIKYADLLKEYAGIVDVLALSVSDLQAKTKELGVAIDPSFPKEKIIDQIYKKTCRPKLIQPTFIVDYPAEFFPLCKKKEEDERLIDAFQLLIGGIEVVKAFSELNDPIDQKARFVDQEKNRLAGDDEAQPDDDSFVEALEYGMPPAGGVGIGLDRLVMLLTDTHNIREVVYFPTLRPRE